MRNLIVTILLLLIVFLSGCQQDPINADGTTGGGGQASGNIPPTTNLFLYPDSTGLDTTTSVLEVHWWGQDPDGWVVGYYVQWDYFSTSTLVDSVWMTSEYATFYLPLDSAYDEFALNVNAVDNAAIWDWPTDGKVAEAEGSEGEVTAGIQDYVEYEAFIDNGSDADVYDSGDSLLWAGNIEGIQTQTGTDLEPLFGGDFSLHGLPPTNSEGAIDPLGDSLLFRIRNTAPVVEFRIESNPTLTPGQVYGTFPTRSFFWEVTDLDGEQTIDSCFYILDPAPGDTNWVGLPGTETSVTLTDLAYDYHRFFLKVQDIAGAYSPTISFPDSTDSFWEVQEPMGDILIVDDYALDTPNQALNLYISIFDTLFGQNEYSVWEVGENLPYSMGDVLANLNYFTEVFWYCFQGSPHYGEAMSAIASFLENDGSILISAAQIDTSSSIIPIADFDNGNARISYPNGLSAISGDWPDLIVEQGNIFSYEVSGFEATTNGEMLYEYGSGVIWFNGPPPSYMGVGVQRIDDLNLVFIGMPLHLLNGTGTLPEFFDKVFNEEFQ
ncbi:hypothetical protein CEE37_01795 [candidate division LCP-89 bacterium B3_LCP]|uniref:Fibronectin type-III domain-containing protein n=1 Tax=candidate division LCP-89 bacterium B3_LCP TaxID=2012998 RepID=A0A532V5H8_UNCL8|nr:MAG: hypothetical protein CEE37_01795 [candidate division LCP-89 bacterium B3_LCP]